MRPDSWAAAERRGSTKAIRQLLSPNGPIRRQLRAARAAHVSWSLAGRIGAGMGLLFIVPFVIVLAAALFGIGIDDVPDIASWVMGALTLVGALALLASIVDCVRNRHIDWFWLFLAGSAFAFWGSVFLESLD